MDFEQWNGFEKGEWKRQIDVRNFIQKKWMRKIKSSKIRKCK